MTTVTRHELKIIAVVKVTVDHVAELPGKGSKDLAANLSTDYSAVFRTSVFNFRFGFLFQELEIIAQVLEILDFLRESVFLEFRLASYPDRSITSSTKAWWARGRTHSIKLDLRSSNSSSVGTGVSIADLNGAAT